MTIPERVVAVGRAGTQGSRLLFGRARYCYCGFVGGGNLGDEAMFEAIRDGLDLGEPYVARPGTPTLPLRLAGRRTSPAGSGVVLGGGTLIGRFGWFERVELALDAMRTRPAVAVGTGVEDPSFTTNSPMTSRAELERWATILRERFQRVTVRGPLSAQILTAFGVEADVVGDPGLLEPGTSTPSPPEEGLIVINLGASGPIWGDQDNVASHMAAYGREIIRRGFRIRIVAMWHQDLEQLQELAANLEGGGAVTIASPGSAQAVRVELARAQVVVGQRLHAAVIATACSTPTIALAYRPKCEDFQASVGRLDFTMRTDQMDVATLLDLTDDAIKHRAAHVRTTTQAVARLRGSLARTLGATRAVMDLPASTHGSEATST